MLIPLDYLVKKYNMHPKGVVHIGANKGQEMADYIKVGIKHFLWVEAIDVVCEQLKNHVARFSFETCKIANECLSDEDGIEVNFHIANNEGQSSSFLDFGTHSKEHPSVKFERDIKLKTHRFDTLIESMINDKIVNKNNFDFLNVDVQGAELKVLKGMGEYLNGFRWLYLECNKAELYRGCPMVEELDEYVRPFGFERVETKWTDFGWGDCLMIKK